MAGEKGPHHNCDSYANCTDTDGSFICECTSGFSGDGVTCQGTTTNY